MKTLVNIIKILRYAHFKTKCYFAELTIFLHWDHNALCPPPPLILHNHCLRFLLGRLYYPGWIGNNAYVTFFFWGGGGGRAGAVSKLHYGLSENGEWTLSYPFTISSNQNRRQLFCLSYLVVCFCFVIGHGWCFEAQWRFAVGRLPSSPVSQAAYPHTHPWYRGSRRSFHAGRGGGWGRRGGRCCGLSLRNDVTAKYGRGCCCSAKLG